MSTVERNGRPVPKLHILSVLVENKSGVLARVASLFARRGYNIHSLAVAPTEDDSLSRITIVVDVATAPLEQITKQLHKLINVIRISELRPSGAQERELMLATVEVEPSQRPEIIGLVDAFGGTIADVGVDAMMISLASSPERLDACEALLHHYRIRQIQRTGRVALPRLSS